jgi:hypothetical protein
MLLFVWFVYFVVKNLCGSALKMIPVETQAVAIRGIVPDSLNIFISGPTPFCFFTAA